MSHDRRDAMGSLVERETALITRLTQLRDPQARLAWAVEQARQRDHLPDDLRRDEFRVPGCLVRLWLIPEYREELCWFRSDSDAVTLRAMTGLLCDVASGSSPSELLAWNAEFLEKLGLLRQLAENRRATVIRVVDMIRLFASQRMAKLT